LKVTRVEKNEVEGRFPLFVLNLGRKRMRNGVGVSFRKSKICEPEFSPDEKEANE